MKGECKRGEECPYRHEKPTDPDDPLSEQNIKDRFFGVNDPVAEKLLNRHQEGLDDEGEETGSSTKTPSENANAAIEAPTNNSTDKVEKSQNKGPDFFNLNAPPPSMLYPPPPPSLPFPPPSELFMPPPPMLPPPPGIMPLNVPPPSLLYPSQDPSRLGGTKKSDKH